MVYGVVQYSFDPLITLRVRAQVHKEKNIKHLQDLCIRLLELERAINSISQYHMHKYTKQAETYGAHRH